MTDQESSLSYPGWKVVLAGFFGVMVSFAAIVPYTFGLFLKPLSLSFGWSRESISIAFSIAALTVAACSPAIGQLLDRYGPRRIILPCIVLFSAALGSLALLTNHIAHFYIVFLVLGVVGNGTAYLGYSRAIASWFVRRRGMAFAVMLAGGGCGAMLLPIFAQSLISNYGWRIAYAGIGLIAFAFGFPLQPFLSANNPPRRTSRTQIAVRRRIRTKRHAEPNILDHLAHRISLLDQFEWLDCASLRFAYRSWSLSPRRSLRRCGNRWIRRYRPHCNWGISRPLLRTACLADHAPAYGCWRCSSFRREHVPTGLTAAILIGFSMGSEGDVTPYLLSRYFGLRRFSTLYALAWTAFAIGGAVGPIVVGRVFDVFGSYRPLSIQLLAIPALIPCLLMFFLPRYKQIVQADPTSIDGLPTISAADPAI